MTRYELVERIGAGGMAEIFRGKAVATGGFEKPVAIKRILPHLSQDKRFVELLIAEAHILSHLRHRNIVQIFDVGLGPDGQYFLVMEYVDGADLRRVQDGMEADHTRLSQDLGLYIGAEVCDALEQAHTAAGPDGQPMRLVHRDVSPSNVLLSRSGEVKLTDFGIAKRPEDVTGHGTVRGKFAYISPEQAVNGSVDARSDVFSAGIVLYELLLGRRLFSQMPDFDALRAVRSAMVPRPMQVVKDVDPRLDRLLMKALAKNPDDRFNSAGELARELREVRYSMPASDADPVQELSSLVARYAAAQSSGEAGRNAVEDDAFEEATVVRVGAKFDPSAGFSLTTDYGEDDDQHRSYVDARQLVSSFEGEVTRAVYDPALLARRRSDDPEDDDDEDEHIGGGEATVVGRVNARRRQVERVSPGDHPTHMMARVEASIIAEDSLPAAPPERMEWSGELGGASGIAEAIEESIDGPTIDRELMASEPAPAYASQGMPAASSTANLVPSIYVQYAQAQEARRRRKRMFIGLGVGAAVLLLLLIVGLTGDSGVAAHEPGQTVDASLSPDAGVPVDAATPDAAPPDAAVKPPKKKPPKKRPPKKKKSTKTTKK